ncbi:AFG2 [Candida pseudojiufengensis]|uniref:AFG2 n=1 Tax=Candida pseudojiufengensis TaxID=497109 RepID=UPI00222560B9|nr:AFG2 [Candida pseudojiufengensis]KAI5962603.1 AFG2 [Candida pseudojiufengensis]
MSSKSTTTKKKTQPSETNAVTPVKKTKIPKSFIVRPQDVIPSAKTVANIYLNSEVFEALEYKPGQLVSVSPIQGQPGIIATALISSTLDKNVIGMSEEFRRLSGLLLGDRVSIISYDQQPPYAQEVVVNGGSTDTEKVLQKVGLIYAGLKINGLTIIDIQDAIENKMDSLSISNSNSSGPTYSKYVSPPYLFTSSTKVEITLEKEPSLVKYPNLPRLMNFSQVGGLSKQIDTLKSTIELPLYNPNLFSEFGISPPRGILLHGAPGTGKTMLLRCIANTIGAHILSINGPSIVSKYLGETENAIRDIFEEATKYQPSIIFMDEVDSLVPSRNSSDTGETESRVVATLLTMMDGMSNTGRIVVVGATNRPNSIDIALRRPGRFDQEIEIGIPDFEARKDILQKQFAKMNKEKHELSINDIDSIAAKTHGYVGADLTALCREAVMKAISRGLAEGIPQLEIKVKLEDLDNALPEIRPSAMREIFLEMPKVHWSDIGGQDELKRKLIEVVQLPLEASESFKTLGVNAPKGVLMYGPPGCSKTLTAKALATESGLNFLAIKGPEVLNKYVGESERTIREIFRKARAASPSIIFLDEIDAIAGDRDGEGTTASKNVLTSLLNEIDGVEELNGVVIIGATNKPSEIDAALLRPGRLDRHIYVAPPDLNARLQILKNCCKKFNLKDDVDLNHYASLTDGCSGAEVTLLCQEAGLNAIMENKDAKTVENKHFEHALNGISRGITPEMLRYYIDFSNRSGLNI